MHCKEIFFLIRLSFFSGEYAFTTDESEKRTNARYPLLTFNLVHCITLPDNSSDWPWWIKNNRGPKQTDNTQQKNWI